MLQVPLVQAPSIKGDRLNAKPMRTEVPVRVIGPTRVTRLNGKRRGEPRPQHRRDARACRGHSCFGD
jgi:hypothetical protein